VKQKKSHSPLTTIFLFISLSLMSKCVFASLDVSDFSDEQICIFAKDPPLSAQVIFEIEARDIICDEWVSYKRSLVSIPKESERFLRLKRWNKMLIGKRPIYSTRSGTNIKIDTFGDEKSIIVDKEF
jgi:hypothetical protein